MIDYLSHFAVSNLCLSFWVALVAWAVHSNGKRPHLAHLLWLLVLAKLVTPPIFSLPLGDISGPIAGTMASLTDRFGLQPPAIGPASPGSADIGIGREAEQPMAAAGPAAFAPVPSGLLLLWALGSALFLTWSLVQLCRFNRLLRMASQPAPPELQHLASELAQRLGLTSTPTIYTTSAHLSPIVWWSGGRVRVVIPATLSNVMSAEQLRWILAHELSHVRRRDHMVRWLEWLACVLFWWNPVTWWARRNLRANEEICCDALVLASLAPEPRTYANALMTAVELLASPPLRKPAMASAMNGGGSLERRLKMIVSKHPIPRPPRSLRALLLVSCLLLPLGAPYAQDHSSETLAALQSIGDPQAGNWRASSGKAAATTGDIQLAESGIVFANGGTMPIRPAYPGAKTVFAVQPPADPVMLNGKRLCDSPVTYVTLLTYNAFALAVHMYDGPNPPEEPNPANISDLARRGKCASYYYRSSP